MRCWRRGGGHESRAVSGWLNGATKRHGLDRGENGQKNELAILI